MSSKSAPGSLPVRGHVPGSLEEIDDQQWAQLEPLAKALRSLGDSAMTEAHAKQLAERFGVHWVSIYRYRARLHDIDETIAIAGRKRGWSPRNSRLSALQEQAVEEAIHKMRKRPGSLRLTDVVDEVETRSRLLGVPCPSRPAIDRRIKRATGEITRAQIFVAVLGASNYTFACATARQTTADWIDGQMQALEFIGGVPKLIVPDQPRALVKTPDRYDPELNPTYVEFTQHYGCTALPARPGHRRQLERALDDTRGRQPKAAVDRAIQDDPLARFERRRGRVHGPRCQPLSNRIQGHHVLA